ncbi:MAG: hypothetical protein JXQ69_02355 [Paludibacteraceae bacterium]|nr:hypothetical protein [Paludibacteraceae bacterium]
MNIKVQIVIVLYKTRIEDCISYNTLKETICNLGLTYSVILYNNSPDIFIPLSPEYELFSPKENKLLSNAYNDALESAKKKDAEYLLLIDQDTSLSKDYFNALGNVLRKGLGNNIAGVLPQIISLDEKRKISPRSYCNYIGPFWFLTPIRKGITFRCLATINSLALLRISAIDEIGGFPVEYPLDGLDTSYFYRFYKKGFGFYVLGIQIKHNLSILNYKLNMNKDRYKSIILSEKKISKEIGFLSIFFFKARLILRFFKQLFVKEKRPYAKITLVNIFN